MRVASFSFAAITFAGLSFCHTARAEQFQPQQQAQQPQQPGCPGASVPLDVSSGFRPFAKLRVKGREGNFLIDTGAVDNHLDTTQFSVRPGNIVTVQGPVLPTIDEARFIAQDMAHQQKFSPPGGYAGAIGTSLMRTRTVAFHYNGKTPYLVLPRQSCSTQYFEQAGYVSISQKGFYGPRNPSGLPVIYAQIGPVRAPIWIDSGFADADSKHMTLTINEALFQKLREASIAMKTAGSTTIKDCTGQFHDEKLWQVQDAPLAFTTETGQSLFEYAPPTLEVRGKTQCALIGDHSEPLGTIGAMMLARWGTVILDGPNERVWVTKNHSPVSSLDPYIGAVMAQADGGGVTVVTRTSVEDAKAVALKSCSEGNKNCAIGVSLSPNQFACFAVVLNADHKFLTMTANSYLGARNTALATCTERGGKDCKLISTTCND